MLVSPTFNLLQSNDHFNDYYLIIMYILCIKLKLSLYTENFNFELQFATPFLHNLIARIFCE